MCDVLVFCTTTTLNADAFFLSFLPNVFDVFELFDVAVECC